jgi:PAS domain-containing protein
MERSEATERRKPVVWPGLWVPLLLLTAGLVTTVLAAHLEARRATAAADIRFYAQHQALVNHLLIHTPEAARAVEAGGQPASRWLVGLFDGALPETLGLRIDTLERHTKEPLLEIGIDGSLDPTRALRTEVNALGEQWMVTTLPAPTALENPADNARKTIWLVGGSLSLAAASLALVLNRRLYHQALELHDLEHRESGADQQITNLQVEKSILRQALNDSEQRSRDLVALSGAVIWELDENARIGFVSPQIADLLDRAPTDLAGQAMEALVAPECQAHFRQALAAARRDNAIERVDLPLLHHDQENRVPVVLRVRALKDTVHGLSGYRVSTLHHVAHSPPA